MTQSKLGLFAIFLTLMVCGMAGLVLHAQQASETRGGSGRPSAPAVSIQDALLLPFDFPFVKPTPLDEVAAHLSKALHAPVVIDQAAIARQDLKVNAEVQLQLQGVRLKTGLKLLLDQLDLTFSVVPEDNLLIITDSSGSKDPIDQVLSELKALHRDVHDVQDAIEDLRTDLGLDEEGGAKMRKPTIIEDLPLEGNEAEKPNPKQPPVGPPLSRSRPG